MNSPNAGITAVNPVLLVILNRIIVPQSCYVVHEQWCCTSTAAIVVVF
jgi:hypothetical protein